MGFSLGIDFGTSTTKVAIRQDDNPPFALPISLTGDKVFMPSVAAYRRTSKNAAELYAIGEDAERVPNTEDYRIIREVKRFLEIKENPPKNFRYQDYPWWNKEKKCIQLWSASLGAEDVIGEIVAEALRRAVRRVRELKLIPETPSLRSRFISFFKRLFRIREKEGGDILAIRGWPLRVGCSVTAGLETRTTLRGVAQSLGFAGFKFEHIREEPMLGSLPYLQRELRHGDVVLVYDFGGGTFDTAVIKIEQDLPDNVPYITVLSADGEVFCGGTDIDRDFAKYLARCIAQKYFKEDYEHKYRQMVEPMVSAELQNAACQAKEILSIQTAYKVTMPPGFLNKPGIELDVTREELESVISESKILDRIDSCLLRGWRKARMILRNENEVCGEFILELDRKNGVIKKDVFDLDFDDLRNMVKHILLIGGTTRIPIVQRHLASLVRGVHFISEKDPYEPIVACALGAALQREHIDSIIDRLAFSIVAKQGIRETEMYRAYTPTIVYHTLTDNPRIKNFISEELCIIKSNSDLPIIEFRKPDGEVISQVTNMKLSRGKYLLEINSLGVIRLGGWEIENPRRHPLQKDIWLRIEKEKERLAQEESERLRKHIFKLPGEDYHLEVG